MMVVVVAVAAAAAAVPSNTQQITDYLMIETVTLKLLTVINGLLPYHNYVINY